MKIKLLDKKGYRKFGITIAIALSLLFGLVFPFLFDNPVPIWPWIISAIFLVCALVFPNVLETIYKPWTAIGNIVGRINTNLLLCIVFFLVFTPVSLIFKMIGRDYLKRKIYGRSESSYWNESEKEKIESMEEVF